MGDLSRDKRLSDIERFGNPQQREAASRSIKRRERRRFLMNNGLSFDEACAVINVKKH